MIFRIYHETLGGHVHMRVFAGKSEGALGKCGDLTMRVEEFEVFRNFRGPAFAVDFRPEPTVGEVLEKAARLRDPSTDWLR